jgi:hypothetical protein
MLDGRVTTLSLPRTGYLGVLLKRWHFAFLSKVLNILWYALSLQVVNDGLVHMLLPYGKTSCGLSPSLPLAPLGTASPPLPGNGSGRSNSPPAYFFYAMSLLHYPFPRPSGGGGEEIPFPPTLSGCRLSAVWFSLTGWPANLSISASRFQTVPRMS